MFFWIHEQNSVDAVLESRQCCENDAVSMVSESQRVAESTGGRPSTKAGEKGEFGLL